ncbi:MAG: hypothetical protein ABL984_06750 [Pyrinomonadaceae bacterium]
MKAKTSAKPIKDRVKPGSHAPRYDLGFASKLATEIYEKTGGAATADEFSTITGNSLKSSAYHAKLAALRNYGLASIEGKIRLTPSAERIVAPLDPDDRNVGLKECFLRIDAFSSVYEKYVGKILPPDEYLKNTFIQLEIPRDLADEWVIQFKTSAVYAGLLMERADGKMQVRGTASGGERQSEPREESITEAPTAIARNTFSRVDSAAVQPVSKTAYQFLIEILNADMTQEEQDSVWILIQYLKRQEAGDNRPTARPTASQVRSNGEEEVSS